MTERTPMEEVLCQMFDLLDKVIQQNGSETIWYDEEETAYEALIGIARIYAPRLADEFVVRLECGLSIRDEIPDEMF